MVARAVESSQLDGNWGVRMGTLSVWPSIRIWLGIFAKDLPSTFKMGMTSGRRDACPESKKKLSGTRITSPLLSTRNLI